MSDTVTEKYTVTYTYRLFPEELDNVWPPFNTHHTPMLILSEFRSFLVWRPFCQPTYLRLPAEQDDNHALECPRVL